MATTTPPPPTTTTTPTTTSDHLHGTKQELSRRAEEIIGEGIGLICRSVIKHSNARDALCKTARSFSNQDSTIWSTEQLLLRLKTTMAEVEKYWTDPSLPPPPKRMSVNELGNTPDNDEYDNEQVPEEYVHNSQELEQSVF